MKLIEKLRSSDGICSNREGFKAPVLDCLKIIVLRIKPNKMVAKAMLARVYLYMNKIQKQQMKQLLLSIVVLCLGNGFKQDFSKK
jgi:hypothetical protein